MSLQIVRDIGLLVKNPKEYLFSFTYSKVKKVKITPFDPQLHRYGKSLVAKIEKSFPKMRVNYFGSSALKIAGQRDIDLVIPCAISQVNRYTANITSLFGEPVKRRIRFSEWSFEKNNCDIQILVIDKNHPLAIKMQKTFDTLKNNNEYLKEYEAVKLSSKGVSEREYTRRRLKFFSDKGL